MKIKKAKSKILDSVLWARQYSKRLIAVLLVVWGIGVVVGSIYEFIRLKIAPETASLDAFYVYLSAPLTCGIPSYVIPNIFLNREKVRQNYIPDYDNKILNGEYVEWNEGMDDNGQCEIKTTEEETLT